MVETLCGRVGCGEPATSVLLMAPQDTQAWLVGLDNASAPEGVPLCSTHADRISVPFGWSLEDQRSPVKPRRKRRKRAAAKPPADPVDSSADELAVVGMEPEADELAVVDVEPEADELTVVDVEPEAASGSEVGPEGEQVIELHRDRVGEAGQGDAPPAEHAAVSADITPIDEPTVQLPTIKLDHPSSPSEVPLNADAAAAAVSESSRRLSVVPGDDDPNKTFDFEDDGQGALWAERAEAERDPDESTPMLKRAFRVVRDD